MKFTPEQVIEINQLFATMNSKDEFLRVLNLAKKYIYGDKVIPFEERQLNYYINYNNNKKSSYISFTVKKKSGLDRTIHAPTKGLKEFQKAVNMILQCVYNPHIAATGFVLGKSIIDNAKPHLKQNYVYNIDLKDFFPSIDKSRIWGRLLTQPFNLGDSNERRAIANMISAICATPMEVERFKNSEWKTEILSVLPQGAPTSPVLTNAICEKLDIRLSGVAKRFGLNYTRYADDITFSSMHNTYENKSNQTEHIYVKDSSFDKEVRRIINDQRFFIKESKVRLQKQGFRQEVTGITVNENLNINSRYIKQLRQWLFYWESFGYEKAYYFFLQNYITNRGQNKKGDPNMALVLEGKLLYLKMIKGENNSLYIQLKGRLDRLIHKIEKVQNKEARKNIVDLILEIGLDAAMEVHHF